MGFVSHFEILQVLCFGVCCVFFTFFVACNFQGPSCVYIPQCGGRPRPAARPGAEVALGRAGGAAAVARRAAAPPPVVRPAARGGLPDVLRRAGGHAGRRPRQPRRAPAPTAAPGAPTPLVLGRTFGMCGVWGLSCTGSSPPKRQWRVFEFELKFKFELWFDV